jgi:hypothetical protein
VPHHLVIRTAAAVVLVGLGIAGYLLWIPVHRPDLQKVAALAATSPVVSLRAHPNTSALDPATAVPIAAVKAAAIQTPGETAVYSLRWKGVAPVTAGSVEVIAMPTLQSAQSAQREILATQLSQTSLTGAGYGFGGTMSAPGIPGAKGAYYLKGTKPTITASTPRATAVVFRAGRVVVRAMAEAKGKEATTTARALASAEYRHLARVGADPALEQTAFPFVASLLYALGGLAVLAVAEATPRAVTTARQRRHDAHVAAQRRARVARGNKVVKRHASRGYAARVEAGARARRR